MAIEVFRRIEQKYIVSKEEYDTIIKFSRNRLKKIHTLRLLMPVYILILKIVI